MKKTAFYTVIASLSLALTACGATETDSVSSSAPTEAAETNTQVTQPHEWEQPSDIAETIHAATGGCPSVIQEADGLAVCGGDDSLYFMSLNSDEHPKVAQQHRAYAFTQDREDDEVLLWDEGWSIQCRGNAVERCGEIHELFPSATWVDLPQGGPFGLNLTSEEPASTFSDGIHLVGEDIQPGTYRTDGGQWCYWERKSSLSGTLDDVIANNSSSEKTQTYVTIEPSDLAFESKRCGTWERVQ